MLDCHVFSTVQDHVVIGHHVYFLLSKVMCGVCCLRSCGACHMCIVMSKVRCVFYCHGHVGFSFVF